MNIGSTLYFGSETKTHFYFIKKKFQCLSHYQLIDIFICFLLVYVMLIIHIHIKLFYKGHLVNYEKLMAYHNFFFDIFQEVQLLGAML